MATPVGRDATHWPVKSESVVTAVEGGTSDGVMSLVGELRDKIKNKLPFKVDISALPSIIDFLRHPNAIDDRLMLLEHVLTFLSQNPGNFTATLQDIVVETLYNDLPHPPSTYVGPKYDGGRAADSPQNNLQPNGRTVNDFHSNPQYAWRTADGSHNNLSDPHMGKAGTGYSRSVQQGHALPLEEMPDPELIFDTLLKREEGKFIEHPAGLSSMMFAFAAVVIHTVFRTSDKDDTVNETSSYVDLAPLYGCNIEAQNEVRKRDGRGHLREDVFAENRVLLLPPQAAVPTLLILFNRNHNYIADKLFQFNERGWYKDPNSIPLDNPERSRQLLKQEEDIFQTARLVNCAWFGSIVFSDYFSAILGLVHQGNNWSLNPFGEIRKLDHSLVERGRGNACSVEFNCLYRWHATTSAHDEKWLENMIRSTFNKDPDELTKEDMKTVGKELYQQASLDKVTQWKIPGMDRNAETGRFKDENLADVLYQAIEYPAHAFGARSTPGCMRLIEIMGIERSRDWGVCSLNDFRRFLGLKPYTSFLEWNPDPSVAAAAEKLYGDIERLELYAGLQAEECKRPGDAAGLCPSFTISRAILADAIALTRGDRFFTADYTPWNMTSWGFADCQRDPNAPGYGSTLGRLLMRTLPDHYTSDSTYTWFPFLTPKKTKQVLTELGDIGEYDSARPAAKGSVTEVSTYTEARQVLESYAFGVRRAARIIEGNGFFIAPSDPGRGEEEQRLMLDAVTGATGAVDSIADVFYQKTKELMVSQSWSCVGEELQNVDVVRDILRHVPLYWACEVAGIKLKSKPDSHDGIYTPDELHEKLTDIYSFLFLDFEHCQFIPLSRKVREHIDELLYHIKSQLGRSSWLSLPGILSTFFTTLVGGGYDTRNKLVSHFSSLGYSSDTLANSLLAVLVGSTVEMSQALVHVVNFYLKENNITTRQLMSLAAKDKLDAKDQAVMQRFVLEALRFDPAFRGVYRETLATEKVGTRSLGAHDLIFVDIAKASMDSGVFSRPQSVDPNRSPMVRYLVGDGVTKCLGLEVGTRLMSEVLRGVFSFPNVRRAPNKSGEPKRHRVDAMKTSTFLYLDREQKPSPWATSMVIQYN